MTDKTLMFQLGSVVSDRVLKLADFYGEGSPEAIIARAIGLLETIKPFVHDGVLTVVDPARDQDDDREVDLEFNPLIKPTSHSVIV